MKPSASPRLCGEQKNLCVLHAFTVKPLLLTKHLLHHFLLLCLARIHAFLNR